MGIERTILSDILEEVAGGYWHDAPVPVDFSIPEDLMVKGYKMKQTKTIDGGGASITKAQIEGFSDEV
jgi:hypothetical protein